MMPEHQIIVDGETLAALGEMARAHGVTYGKIVELLVKERLSYVPDSVDPSGR